MPSQRLEIDGHDIVAVRADNPGPFTLEGTNSWVLGAGSAWVIDPGPARDEHVEALVDEIARRGGLAGIALTHDHSDHAGAIGALRARFPDAPLAAARGDVDVALADGHHFGPLQALATPGHAPDHLAYLVAPGPVAFTGDAVLGRGSVFVAPDPGALVGYLDGLRRLRDRRPVLLAPGHGPLVVDADDRLGAYIAHRLDRERRLLDALDAGARTVPELLDDAWSEVPDELRPAAAVTLAAHLDKLAVEGRLPAGVDRPPAAGPLHRSDQRTTE